MPELSPQAWAVLNAAYQAPDDGNSTRQSVAAALRAAVAHTQQHHNHDVWKCDADELLAIADELEAQ
jgi:ribosomal protein S7